MTAMRRVLSVGLVAGMAWAAPVSAAPFNTVVTTIANPTPQAGARFGLAVEPLGDVNGDGISDFAVGAPGADRVDVLSGATHGKIRSIVDPENKPGNDFGWALAAVGDVNGDGVSDLAVGAPGDTFYVPLPCLEPPCVADAAQGRAFLFSGATGALIRKLSPADAEFLALGYAVAGLGDVNGDGVPDIAVGAPLFHNNRGGQVYAFSGANGAILWNAKEPPEALASFGASLAAIPDISGDGRRDLVLGAYYHDGDPGPGTSLVGRAYILNGATGAEIRHHDNPLGSAGKTFGFSATSTGDQTGDGVADYAISDPGASRVHLYNGASGAALGTVATPGAADDDFGADLSTSEDRSGDGLRDLWVGAPGGGKVYLLTGAGTLLLTLTDPTPAGPANILGFGLVAAPTPDLGGDAGTDLLIGEPGDSAEFGAVHLALITANRAPTADAGADVAAECAGPGGTTVHLDGSASSDPDGDTLTYTWRDSDSNVVGTTAIVDQTLALGSRTFTLTVSDGFGGTDTDTVTVTVADTEKPVVTVSLSPSTLWPPNHRLVPIQASVSATDVCTGSMSPVLGPITSNEPDNGLGDGDTAGDVAIPGPPGFPFALRAERSATGDGRVYTVSYLATDPSGNTGVGTATVSVPRARGG